MENKTFKFKTNINCGGCIKAVTPHLSKTEGIDEWNVDTNNPDKILTVQSNGVSEEKIIETVKKAGYKIAPIHS
ncbi:MAG: heavy-metal-associated domain-containing protein [Bacteroidetes bacterium]|nr:heavy-metal-associated domain-containing protein [Bacteroidota bacterium]